MTSPKLIPWNTLRVSRAGKWLRGIHKRRFLTLWREGKSLPGTVCSFDEIPVVPKQIEWANFVPALARKGGRPGRTDKTVVLSIRLEKEVHDAMQRHLQRNETRSGMIRRVLRAFLKL